MNGILCSSVWISVKLFIRWFFILSRLLSYWLRFSIDHWIFDWKRRITRWDCVKRQKTRIIIVSHFYSNCVALECILNSQNVQVRRAFYLVNRWLLCQANTNLQYSSEKRNSNRARNSLRPLTMLSSGGSETLVCQKTMRSTGSLLLSIRIVGKNCWWSFKVKYRVPTGRKFFVNRTTLISFENVWTSIPIVSPWRQRWPSVFPMCFRFESKWPVAEL